MVPCTLIVIPPTLTVSLKPKSLPNGRIRGALWAGYPCEARCVRVMVGPSEWPWCQSLVGTQRKAIEVKMDGWAVYLDNEDGRALAIMLKGYAPLPRMRFLPAYEVLDDPTAQPFYQAEAKASRA